ncbi:hypothetical protein [Candidatus Methylocalor cossyra]|uniref:Uncharacterized protein n=1 Tax=Candidatus Methylocalor cossyra TaxID=3108543 RepID=A0ABP1CA70_9GAMM
MKKAILVAAGLLILVLGGHTLLDWSVELVEIVLETVELITERLLEAVLTLTPYQAQATTAWLGFSLLVVILVLGYRKTVSWGRRLRLWVPSWWEEEKNRLRTLPLARGWILGSMGVLFVLALLYLSF